MNGTQRIGFGSLVQNLPAGWKLVGTPDFNGDGKPDLLWQNTLTGDVSYWKMDGTQRTDFGFLLKGVPIVYWRMKGLQRESYGTIAASIPLEWQLTGLR